MQKKALKRIPVLKKTKVKKANRPKPNQIVKENEEVSTCPDDTLSSQNSVKSVDVSLGSLDTSNDSLISQNRLVYVYQGLVCVKDSFVVLRECFGAWCFRAIISELLLTMRDFCFCQML